MLRITHYWGEHEFEVHRYNDVTWADVGGIYVFALPESLYGWRPLYIGKASSFKNRLSNHERWDEAVKRGVVHVHAKVVSREVDRDTIERNLIQRYQPPMNDKLKNSGLAALFGTGLPPTAPGSEFMNQLQRLSQLGGLTPASREPQPQQNLLARLMNDGLGLSPKK